MNKIEKLHELYSEAADTLWSIKWYKSPDQKWIGKNFLDEKIAELTEEFVRISMEITRLQFGAVIDDIDLCGKVSIDEGSFSDLLKNVSHAA